MGTNNAPNSEPTLSTSVLPKLKPKLIPKLSMLVFPPFTVLPLMLMLLPPPLLPLPLLLMPSLKPSPRTLSRCPHHQGGSHPCRDLPHRHQGYLHPRCSLHPQGHLRSRYRRNCPPCPCCRRIRRCLSWLEKYKSQSQKNCNLDQ